MRAYLMCTVWCVGTQDGRGKNKVLTLLIVGIHGYNCTAAGQLPDWQVLCGALGAAACTPCSCWEGNTQVSGSFVAVQMMCFTVFAMDFMMFATLLWAHSTKPLSWGCLTGGVTAQERHPRVCQATERGNTPPSWSGNPPHALM